MWTQLSLLGNRTNKKLNVHCTPFKKVIITCSKLKFTLHWKSPCGKSSPFLNLFKNKMQITLKVPFGKVHYFFSHSKIKCELHWKSWVWKKLTFFKCVWNFNIDNIGSPIIIKCLMTCSIFLCSDLQTLRSSLG